MKIIYGQFFDGLRPTAVQARIEFSQGHATLTAGAITAGYANSQLIVSPRISRADRFICFPDGSQFLCANRPFLDALPQESPSEGIVAWLENRWKVALGCVVVVICALLSGYFFGLPALSKHIAAQIPMETEQVLGSEVLQWFDEKQWLKPSELDLVTQQKVRTGFDILINDLPLRDYYVLELRSSTIFGPNAFALPGGIIVVTDDLVKISETDEEIVAVLAHEIGHVEHRHAIRSVLQNSVVAAAAATVSADAATLSVAVASLPVILARTKYSREFETAADEYAFRLLKQNGYSPEAFASIMEKIAIETDEESPAFGYLSTHPAAAERVRRARESAATGEANR